jgi:hypothetical protein
MKNDLVKKLVEINQGCSLNLEKLIWNLENAKPQLFNLIRLLLNLILKMFGLFNQL